MTMQTRLARFETLQALQNEFWWAMRERKKNPNRSYINVRDMERYIAAIANEVIMRNRAALTTQPEQQ